MVIQTQNLAFQGKYLVINVRHYHYYYFLFDYPSHIFFLYKNEKYINWKRYKVIDFNRLPSSLFCIKVAYIKTHEKQKRFVGLFILVLLQILAKQQKMIIYGWSRITL